MSSNYDEYYQTENLFGKPYPELISFYASFENKGKLLDLGCGQGRDAIALAKLGYQVTGIDYSSVGINQLNTIAKNENLPLKGIVGDIYQFSEFHKYDFILMDSMFHFGKKEKDKEVKFLENLFSKSATQTYITICIQNTKHKIDTLDDIISSYKNIQIIDRINLVYTYKDQATNHESQTQYEMITLKKT